MVIVHLVMVIAQGPLLTIYMVVIHIVRNQVSLIHIYLRLNLPMSLLEVMKTYLITWIHFSIIFLQEMTSSSVANNMKVKVLNLILKVRHSFWW